MGVGFNMARAMETMEGCEPLTQLEICQGERPFLAGDLLGWWAVLFVVEGGRGGGDAGFRGRLT